MPKLKLSIDGLRREQVLFKTENENIERSNNKMQKIVPPRSTKSGIDLVKKFLPTPSYSSGFE
jgi:hypothetical protein